MKISFDVYEETAAPTTTATLSPATPGPGRTYTDPVTVNFSSTDPANADPTQPVAGVDYIEHRVTLNGVPGAWVRSTNPGLVNPFTSSVTVSELGAYSVEYRSADRGGNADPIKTVTFWINRPTTTTGKVSAIVPSTLSLAVSELKFSPFIPGVSQTYTGTSTATVTSSWANAALSVYDPDPNNATNGRLMHVSGSVIPRDMDVLNSVAAYSGHRQRDDQPDTIATWATPVASQAATITLRQVIQNNDVLVSGEYAKTLTFALSTTTP